MDIKKSDCNCYCFGLATASKRQFSSSLILSLTLKLCQSHSVYIIFKQYLGRKERVDWICIFIPAEEYHFFKRSCWKEIIFLPTSVSSRELKFPSHGFMDHRALHYPFCPQEQSLFHCHVCQSPISVHFQIKERFLLCFGFFSPRETVFSNKNNQQDTYLSITKLRDKIKY